MRLKEHILEVKNRDRGENSRYFFSHVRIVGEGEVLSAPAETRHTAMLRIELPQLEHVFHEDTVQSNLSDEDWRGKSRRLACRRYHGPNASQVK